MNNLWILAQPGEGQSRSTVPAQPEGDATMSEPGGSQPAPDDQTQRSGRSSPLNLLFPILLMAVFMYLLLFRGPRKQQQQHRKMLQSLKKNDRVRTIGGILGTIMEVRGDEVILKIDESNNTRIRVSTSAISKSVSEEQKN